MDNELREAVGRITLCAEQSSISHDVKILLATCQRVLDAAESLPDDWKDNISQGKYVIVDNYAQFIPFKTPTDESREDYFNSHFAYAVRKVTLDQCSLVIAKNYRRVDELRWAENLILQLPKIHEGRNSWLGNYGISDEAKAIHNEMIGGE